MARAIQNILICGGGMMGKGIAHVFSSLTGARITVYDIAYNDFHSGLTATFAQLVEHGVYSKEEAEARAAQVRFSDDFAGAAKDADLVVECVFEDMALKQETFKKLEAACRPDTIFCTNTSVMSPTQISAELTYQERFVGTHFWNPAYLIPLVEVVKTDATSDEAAQTVLDVLNRAGKKAVLCKKDVPGFIANRMQHALWREAISIVENGIADAQTVDEAVKNSFGLRLPQLPPLENADMVGLDLTWNIHEYILPHLEDAHEPSKLLAQMRARGDNGYKSGRGFFERSPEEIAGQKAGLNEYLIKMIYGK